MTRIQRGSPLGPQPASRVKSTTENKSRRNQPKPQSLLTFDLCLLTFDLPFTRRPFRHILR